MQAILQAYCVRTIHSDLHDVLNLNLVQELRLLAAQYHAQL